MRLQEEGRARDNRIVSVRREPTNGPTRRDFLKIAGSAAGALALGSASRSNAAQEFPVRFTANGRLVTLRVSAEMISSSPSSELFSVSFDCSGYEGYEMTIMTQIGNELLRRDATKDESWAVYPSVDSMEVELRKPSAADQTKDLANAAEVQAEHEDQAHRKGIGELISCSSTWIAFITIPLVFLCGSRIYKDIIKSFHVGVAVLLSIIHYP